jgi:hypothetical protein
MLDLLEGNGNVPDNISEKNIFYIEFDQTKIVNFYKYIESMGNEFYKFIVELIKHYQINRKYNQMILKQ